MAFISDDKIWCFELYNNLSAKDRVQVLFLNHLKLKVNDTSKKDEKITTKFEPSKDENDINKAYLDAK